jgi:hypothetical protein
MGVSLVAMAVAAYPVLTKFSPSATIAYFGARVLEPMFHMLNVISMLALVKLGTEHVKSEAADTPRFQTLGDPSACPRVN